MYVTCNECGWTYNDEHKWTICPHRHLFLSPHPEPDMSQQPSIGRIVHYVLKQEDVDQVARRRTTGQSIAERLRPADIGNPQLATWPAGAQAHIGNPVAVGDEVPLVIVRVWPDEYGPGKPGVNGQAMLDGNDVLWLTSIAEDEAKTPGTWHWPERV